MCGMQRPPTDPTSTAIPLLTAVVEHALDDGYAAAAARRGDTGRARLPGTARGRAVLACGLLLVALVVTVEAAQAWHAAPTLAREKRTLVSRVHSEDASTDALQRRVGVLSADVSARQRAALHQKGTGAADLVALLSGATAVQGPGVRLVVDDAKTSESDSGDGARENDDFSDTGRVRDQDMQRIVNGLWSSGAEAVSINGQRLTALSAIRAAGDAILVDNRPLVPPYTVLAIGNGSRLRAVFEGGSAGRYLRSLHTDFGIRADLTVRRLVRLPAAPGPVLRSARPVPAATPAPHTTGKGAP
jgi:uncharacterized protein YlxW (UPF0749 family)